MLSVLNADNEQLDGAELNVGGGAPAVAARTLATFSFKKLALMTSSRRHFCYLVYSVVHSHSSNVHTNP